MSEVKKNATIIIRTQSFKLNDYDEIFTLAYDKNTNGEINELTFEDLRNIDDVLHAFVLTHMQRGGQHE